MSEDQDARLISYSINAEDVLLRRIFGGRRTGFFVDVGAEDPVHGNDFFGLYELGWRGINVEPNPAYFALLQEKRPEDRNLQVLVSDTPSDALPFYIVEGTGLSTCDAEMAAQHEARQADVHRVEMRAATLAEILEQEAPPPIDVLKVDVEGFEEKVLRGNDWDRFRPSVIMFEVTLPQSPVRRETGITAYLQGKGYRFAYHDGLNDFFVERDFVVAPDSLRAPNVFDNVVRWETVALRDGFADVERYAKALEGERDVVGETLSATERNLADERRKRHRVAMALETTQRIAIDLLANDHDGVDTMLGGTGRELVVLNGYNEPQDDDATVASTHLQMLQALLDTLQRERNGLVQTVKDLETQNRRLAAGNAQLQGERLALHRALDQERAQSHILSEARQALSGLRGLVEDESASRTEKADAVALRLEQANAEAARIERDNEAAALRQSEQAEQARRDRVSQRYAGVRPARDGDAAMIQALYASTSWKLTRPVRAFGRLLGSRKS